MDTSLIYNGESTVEDIMILAGLGYEFVIEDGNITDVLHN